MIELVTVTLSVVINMWGNVYVRNDWHTQPMTSWEECVAKKHELEFLPPVGINTAQVYFCVRNE